jgi:hypothetical protein
MPSEAVDVDHGQVFRRRLKNVATVVDLHELSPVGDLPPLNVTTLRERISGG